MLERKLVDRRGLAAIVVSNCMKWIQRLVTNQDLLQSDVQLKVIKCADEIPTDPNGMMPFNQVTILFDKVSRGLHLQYYDNVDVFVDHIPESYDLL